MCGGIFQAVALLTRAVIRFRPKNEREEMEDSKATSQKETATRMELDEESSTVSNFEK